MAGAVEHVVRRHLYHGGAASLSGSSQIAGSHMVQFIAKLRIVFRLVYRRISGTVYDNIHPVAGHECTYGLFITYIQFLHICKEVSVLLIFSGERPHLVAKLTVGAGYQYIHLNSYYLFPTVMIFLLSPTRRYVDNLLFYYLYLSLNLLSKSIQTSCQSLSSFNAPFLSLS